MRWRSYGRGGKTTHYTARREGTTIEPDARHFTRTRAKHAVRRYHDSDSGWKKLELGWGVINCVQARGIPVREIDNHEKNQRKGKGRRDQRKMNSGERDMRERVCGPCAR